MAGDAMTSILVTGGMGFIGRALVRYILEETSYDVVILDRNDEATRPAEVAALRIEFPNRLAFAWHDLKAPIYHLQHTELSRRFKYVAHLAASSHVDRSVRDPMSFVFDNVVGTGHLLEWARGHVHEPEKTLVFSTDEVFGPAGPRDDFDEYAAHWPANPYAASKAAAEALAPAWANTYGLPILVSHCSNAFGAGQHPEKFIPLAIDRVKRGETIQIHARNGVPSSRYYIHVRDIASAIMTILECGSPIAGRDTGRYNISATDEVSNVDVVERIAALLGKSARYELVDNVPGRPKHDQRYAITSKRLELLGWKPRVGFEEGLRRTVEASR
jgi:dTDP-glucose 4,6-dehydratase